MPSVDASQKKVGDQQIDDRWNEEMPQEGYEGIGDISVDGNEQVLRIPDRAHDASDRNGEGEGEEKKPRRDIVLSGKVEHDRGADHGHRVVHEKGRDASHSEENGQYQEIDRFDPPEELIGKPGQRPARFKGLSDNEHSEEKQDDIDIDCLESAGRRNRSRRKRQEGASEHDLPYFYLKSTDAPQGDHHKDNRHNHNRNHIPVAGSTSPLKFDPSGGITTPSSG